MSECEYVGDSAFCNNKNFTSLTLKDGCTIGARAFEVDDANNSTMVDANINVDIGESNNLMNYATSDEKVDAKQLKQLEDDRNSSTGNV